MTVAELIEKLRSMPSQDCDVVLPADGFWDNVHSVEFDAVNNRVVMND